MSANEADCCPESMFAKIEAALLLSKWIVGFVLAFQAARFAKLLMR